jgi:hypothetical protein
MTILSRGDGRQAIEGWRAERADACWSIRPDLDSRHRELARYTLIGHVLDDQDGRLVVAGGDDADHARRPGERRTDVRRPSEAKASSASDGASGPPRRRERQTLGTRIPSSQEPPSQFSSS